MEDSDDERMKPDHVLGAACPPFSFPCTFFTLAARGVGHGLEELFWDDAPSGHTFGMRHYVGIVFFYPRVDLPAFCLLVFRFGGSRG